MSGYTLSDSIQDRAEYERIVDKTKEAILSSYSDDSAFSGINPYQLRRQIEKIGLLQEDGLGFDRTLQLVKDEIMPHLLRTWSRSYMPHLHSPALLESLSAEMIISAFNDSMDSWDQGPAATEVEAMVIKELLRLFGFDRDCGDGAFTSGGSQSNLTAITAARDKVLMNKFSWDVKKKGLIPDFHKLRLYTSEISHFSMDKSAHLLGLGYDAVRRIKVNDRCQVDIPSFEKMLKEDSEKGLIPFMAVATLGTTDYGSIDDVGKIRRLSDSYGMHLHLDAAYGSALILSDKEQKRLGSIELADSITIDFHKMFLLPISCSAVLFKDKKDLEPFLLHADYLNREEDEEDGYLNLVGKGIQTTRRFDALKVLFSCKARGRREYASIIEKSLSNAEYVYRILSGDESFIAPVKPELSSVVFALKGGDDLNRRVRRTLLEEGCVIGQTVKDGSVMLKLTLLNPNLEKEDLENLIKHIKEMR